MGIMVYENIVESETQDGIRVRVWCEVDQVRLPHHSYALEALQQSLLYCGFMRMEAEEQVGYREISDFVRVEMEKRGSRVAAIQVSRADGKHASGIVTYYDWP